MVCKSRSQSIYCFDRYVYAADIRNIYRDEFNRVVPNEDVR